MVIFLYNLYIFGIHVWTVLYPKQCYNEPCYKEVNVYVGQQIQASHVWIPAQLQNFQGDW